MMSKTEKLSAAFESLFRRQEGQIRQQQSQILTFIDNDHDTSTTELLLDKVRQTAHEIDDMLLLMEEACKKSPEFITLREKLRPRLDHMNAYVQEMIDTLSEDLSPGYGLEGVMATQGSPTPTQTVH